MKRKIATTERNKRKPDTRYQLRASIIARIRWIVLLGLFLIVLIYFHKSIPQFSRDQRPPQEIQQKDRSGNKLGLWAKDFESLLSHYFIPSNWVQGLQNLENISDSKNQNFELRISFPNQFSVHLLMMDILNLAHRHRLSVIESFEHISPYRLGIGITGENGNLLRINFKENADLVWYEGEIAVIIDDFGYSMGNSVHQFLDFPFPITFAVIPETEYCDKIANLAHTAGFDVLIHLPMESLNKNVENNGYTIFTRMSEKQIHEAVTKAKKAVPHAIGVNNHMGSKATINRKTMARLMRSLKKHNLLFVDSVTNRKSVAFAIARQTGVPALKLTTYLDNPESSKSIKEKLQEVVRRIRNGGSAVIIGHNREETAKTLASEMNALAYQGISFVKLNELLENP